MSSISAIVATLDLQLVQLIRAAMAAADAQGVIGAGPSAKTQTAAVGRSQVPAVDQPLTYRAVDSVMRGGIERSDTRSSAGVYEKFRPVTLRLPRVHDCKGRTPVVEPAKPSSIQPPWRTLPWPVGSGPNKTIRRIIKVEPGRTDVRDVGQTLDIFI